MKYLRNKRTGQLLSYDPVIAKDFAFKYEVYDDSEPEKPLAEGVSEQDNEDIRALAKKLVEAKRKTKPRKPGMNDQVGVKEKISIQLTPTRH